MKLKYFLYQIYKWIIVIPTFAVATVIFSLFTGILIYISAKAANYCGVMWAKTMSFVTPMKIHISGKEKIDSKQSYIIVANHQSAYDIFALYGFLPISFRWIMKKELRKAFFIGRASARVGHIFIDRSSPRAALKSINDAKSKLQNGISVVIFPEGTRSGSNKVMKFKTGAFRLASELNLPILPVTIKDTCKVYSGGAFNVNPGSVNLFIGDAIIPADYNYDIHKLRDIAQKVIIEPIKEFNCN